MKGRLVIVLAVFILSTAIPSQVRATDFATACKWGFPWPRTVSYYVGNFTSTEAGWVANGASPWNNAGFNLSFSRTFSSILDYHRKGAVENWGNLGETYTFRADYSRPCNPDIGNPLTRVYTIYNEGIRWNNCSPGGEAWCAANSYYDLTNVAAHEFGHWFHLGHPTSDLEATMDGGIALGETKKRTLNSHDIDSARVMYGYR